MKLKSFKYLTGLLVFFLFTPLWSEEKIDIWKNNTKKKLKPLILLHKQLKKMITQRQLI